MKRFALRSQLLAFAFVAALPAGALATTAHLNTAHPVSVTTCKPQRNTYMAGGYPAAYYPGGRYWGWPTVYGGAYSYYQYPVEGHPTLSIDYTNATGVVMKNIEFGLIGGGELVAEVRDVGTFSPGAEIKHEFGLSPSIFPLRTSVVHCVPLKIDFVDGTTWKNPHLPALNQGIYGRPHMQ
jgi:hypothetical protein